MIKSAILPIVFFLFGNTSVVKLNENTYAYIFPEFFNNLRVIPVQFTDKMSDKSGNIYFEAVFASNLVVNKVTLVLPANPSGEEAFFEQNKDWEEKIDRKDFLKKFKKDFWLTTYLKDGKENIIINAHQFKEWRDIKTSYAGNLEHLRRNVDNPEFWEDLRIKNVFFYKIDKEKAYGLSLQPVHNSEPWTEKDRQHILLDNNQKAVEARITDQSGSEFRVTEKNVYYLQKNTVFNKQEVESKKSRKMLNLTIVEAKLRLRALPLEEKYFLENWNKSLWICFYDSKYQTVSRLVEDF